MNKRAFAVPLIFLASVTSAAAAPRVATSGDWGVYSYQRDGKAVCYALSVPRDAEPAGVDHGRNYFLIAPAQGADRKEPEVIAGYPLKAGSMIEVSIGQKTFRMFTKDNTGWVNNTVPRSGADASLAIGANHGSAGGLGAGNPHAL
ncbi:MULTISPECIES: hypothetical protein [Rhizobium]|uniref:hypothetical protein n=1 Tax=Rhizobium TaxID=379 RepID=UPI001FEE9C00|nr:MULTISPECIES: hypothetical protein [Rhizobium]